ncbi:hypothetical protein PGTUg99_036733 [Puccinia graminis f. sp. tritici]|uniref:Uncharacterized protein n=1 Tax=Puccinia graminis f. sp. tritici TaxID=56615 RepID=A0A5B0SEU5_PUCGR|nr:hypothetical protein PGTUg99_036733 [Puccinia graminis f. sp. tritici]
MDQPESTWKVRHLGTNMMQSTFLRSEWHQAPSHCGGRRSLCEHRACAITCEEETLPNSKLNQASPREGLVKFGGPPTGSHLSLSARVVDKFRDFNNAQNIVRFRLNARFSVLFHEAHREPGSSVTKCPTLAGTSERGNGAHLLGLAL